MPDLGLSPALSVLAAFTRSPQPLRMFFRSARNKLRPPRPVPYAPASTPAQDELLATGRGQPRQLSTLLRERRSGTQPTIVIGGFVPDSTEQVFLLRGSLLRRGSVYYFHYPRRGFSLELFCAQLDDLVAELNVGYGQRPVIFAVSFGAGVLLEWLRRNRAAGRNREIAGSIMVSPVACAEDLITPGEAKPSTLLGRAVKPYLLAGANIDRSDIEKSRVIFAKMFEAGAQNKAALRALLTVDELSHLRDRVLGAIHHIDPAGAVERVSALCTMPPLSAWTAEPGQLPLSDAPTQILYAEKEGAVLTEQSPTRKAFESMLPTFFSRGEMRIVRNGSGNPVQHASLIFHYFQFLPHIVEFYRGLKSRKFRVAA
jgi:hypothetical protein